MRRRVQISFVSVFLTLLTVAFATALVVRVRSYSATTASESSPVLHGTLTSRAARSGGTVGSPTTTLAPLSDGTAVPATSLTNPSPSSTPSSTPFSTTTSASSARARRLRELLALGAPDAGPAAPPAVAPSVKTTPVPAPVKLQQVTPKPVQPVANALRQNQSTTTQPGQQPSSGNKPPNPPTTEARDPNSDTAPPQLLSVNFDPPQVQDGGDSNLIIVATDDLSGIRGISGTLTSPTGKAVQGFAQLREGETTRYVSRIHIPEKAEEGIWKISFLTMSDMATNSVTLSFAQGTLPPTAILKVNSSASDSTAPTLKNAWLDRAAMRAGEHNTLHIDAQDEKSGVHLVAAVFLSPSKAARFGVGCTKGANDVWDCDVFPPQCLDCGDWTLEQVQLQDNANNFATVRQENPAVQAVRLNITGDSCDNKPPVLQGLALSRTEIVMGRDEPVIEVTAQVLDDSCGVGGVSGQIVGPGGNSSGTFFSLQQRDGTTYVGSIRLDPHAARGVWRMQSLTVNDKGQNLKIYYANDPLLARAMFTVK